MHMAYEEDFPRCIEGGCAFMERALKFFLAQDARRWTNGFLFGGSQMGCLEHTERVYRGLFGVSFLPFSDILMSFERSLWWWGSNE
jgi:hypothetical protein